jgi:hypothetical protein
MLLSALLVGAVLSQAAPPAAPPTTVAPATVTGERPAGAPLTYAPAKAADQKNDQLVCKSEAVLGSRLPVRRCRTVGDIKDRALQDQQAIDRAQANIHIKSD